MKNGATKLREAEKQHRAVKADVLTLLDKFENKDHTREYLKNQLFKIYLKVK